MTPRQYVGLRISTDAEAVPTINDIDEGDLAINLASERIYMRFGEQIRDITDRYTRSEIDQLLAGKADATHGHDWGEIDGKPATATRWPAFSEVTDKPSTYPPDSHAHTLSQITDAGSAASADVADFDPAGTAASEAYTLRRHVDQLPDPLLMHFL